MHRRIVALVAAAVSVTLWLPATPARAVPQPVTATTATTANYLAAGDSIAAGLGVGRDSAYPAILDHLSRRLALVDNVAVSGATIADVLTQLASVPESDRAAVTRISITVGANDVGWGTALFLCLNTTGECADTVIDPTTGATLEQSVDAALAGLAVGLPALLAQARQWYPNATVYVSSYYRLFGSRPGDCTLAEGYTVSRVNKKWLNAMADGLNATIRHAVMTVNLAAHARVSRYANAAKLFRGHGFCDTRARWVFGPAEVALGLVDAGAIAHPNRRGQAGFALAFLRARIA